MPRRESESPAPALTKEALAAWTHDLRNPLAALVANLHHLRETLTPHLDGDSEEVFAECLALFGLLDRYTANLDILAQGDAALAERGQPVDLVDLANDVAGRLGPYASVTGHRIRVLVQGEGEPKVETDRVILRRLLENLVSNALENAPAGPVDLVVSARPGAAGSPQKPRDEGAVAVVDRGPSWPSLTPPSPGAVPSRVPGARYGRGLGLEAALLAANVIGARLEIGASSRGEPSVTVFAPLHTPAKLP